MKTIKQKEIIIGTLLGDGHLEKNGKHTRLRVDHYNKHKKYVFWLAKELIPFSLKPRAINETDKRSGKVYSRWHISTKSLQLFDEFRALFYRGRIKIVPRNLEALITPLSLAIWYMDDGSLDFRPKSHCAFSLKTNAFTLEECRLLSKILDNNFGIKSSVQYPLCRGKRYPQIYIGKSGRDQFVKTIAPFIINCFQYKLPHYN